MIDKKELIDFFNKCAPTWDKELIKNDAVINTILDNAGIGKGQKILDVACGTGVLTDYYLERGIQSVTGIDISPEMIVRAKAKLSDDRVRYICGDVLSTDVGRDFDVITVYNALPHFPEPERLIEHLSGLLIVGGRLTVAHGMSRKMIDAHHHGAASRVSTELMEVEKLAELFGKYLSVSVTVSDDRMYQAVGIRKK